MKIKKKIIRKSFDYQAERNYYKEASICPNCGRSNNLSRVEQMKAELRNEASIKCYHMLGGGYFYECKHCGCQWEVKNYRGD